VEDSGIGGQKLLVARDNERDKEIYERMYQVGAHQGAFSTLSYVLHFSQQSISCL